MTFKPTDEQLACVAAAVDTKDNLLVQALAGAAKTATIVLMAEALAPKEILCLAFNKKIAVEMADRLPHNCKSSTLNALGHRIWADMVGSRLNLDTKKMYSILSDIVKDLDGPAKEAAWKSFKELLATAKEAKAYGYIPDSFMEEDQKKRRPNPLRDDGDFFAECEFNLEPWEQSIVRQCVIESIEQAYAGTIDFDDQIYMPTCFRAIFPIYGIVMVDEAQDLSGLNHRFLTKLARKRLIAVGDPCQAIYGFRGASESSMKEMEQQFRMRKLVLTTSFRCPERIIEHVRWRAPEMKHWSNHPHNPGQIARWNGWSITDVPDNAAVICRNNAPLYKMAITFLKHNRAPKLIASDIGKSLVTLLKKLGPANMGREDALQEVRIWLADKERRSRARKTFRDQAECMSIFIEQTETLGQAMHFALSLMNYEGAVQFMTGHKAKGMEFPDVFFLDEELVTAEGQDPNLRYVICTRATQTLTYIDSRNNLEIIEAQSEEME